MSKASFSAVEEKSAEKIRGRVPVLVSTAELSRQILFGTLGAYFWLVCVLGTIAGTEECMEKKSQLSAVISRRIFHVIE